MPLEIAEKTKTEPRARIHGAESRVRQKRRRLLDRGAKWVVALGGFAIIASILAILVFIVIEIAPLFRPARVASLESSPASDLGITNPVAAGLDENQEVGYILGRDGKLQFFETADRKKMSVFQVTAGRAITCVWQSLKGDRLVVGTGHGQSIEVDVQYNSRFFEGKRSYKPHASTGELVQVDADGQPLTDVFAAGSKASLAIAAVTQDGRVWLFMRRVEESLFGDAEVDSASYQIEPRWSGRPLSVAIDNALQKLYVGSDDGKIYYWRISPDSAPEFLTVAKASRQGAGITELTFLIGGRSLVVGDASGEVSVWFPVRDETAPSGWRLTRIREMKSHPAAVTRIAPSARGKGFISGDAGGNLFLQYSTSERFLADFNSESAEPVSFINYAPKANGALTIAANGELTHWGVDNPHPEAGLKAFFGKVWYEGYEKPEYVWQSTGGTDEFEPKLSLVPLIFGSFKGTLYALLIAIPLAIFGALYTSQFMHPGLRNKIKPTVEIMAALPSVVLGFLGGLWLAPRMEKIVPAVLLMMFVLPALIVLSAVLWHGVPRRLRNRFRPGIESLLLIPIVLGGIVLCMQLNGVVEATVFGGDFKAWLLHAVGIPFDQRNALVVGIAMGFAVIPIIYTISEDALSNVPSNLVSGSLALGATRWQTAIRVVLPTAAAGIFSAVMIGLGRAVGETMIVLMATGNTPIMDWNIFNGFRTLSANIAVEIPEAPVGGTLYRVLFMAAMLLFLITFAVNTMAEVVRQRLREKYQKL